MLSLMLWGCCGCREVVFKQQLVLPSLSEEDQNNFDRTETPLQEVGRHRTVVVYLTSE
jgi:hypothetical protein